jgi:ferredoxin
MAHIITGACNDCKYTDCCVVCPVECFYQDELMLYIDPQDCIDCEACVPECPVEAIFHQDKKPDAIPSAEWDKYIQLNADRSADLKNAGGHITEKQDPKEGPLCKKK